MSSRPGRPDKADDDSRQVMPGEKEEGRKREAASLLIFLRMLLKHSWIFGWLFQITLCVAFS